MTTLEQISQQLASLDTSTQQPMKKPGAIVDEMFQENFSMPKLGSMFSIQNGNILIIGVGVIASTTVGDLLSGWVPQLSKWGTILAGLVLMYVAKGQKILRDFGAGVLIGGLATMFSGTFSGLFGEKSMMMEDRMTYGGVDGIYPTQPERRVFS